MSSGSCSSHLPEDKNDENKRLLQLPYNVKQQTVILLVKLKYTKLFF